MSRAAPNPSATFRAIFVGVFTFSFYALTIGAVVFLIRAPLPRKPQVMQVVGGRQTRLASGVKEYEGYLTGGVSGRPFNKPLAVVCFPAALVLLWAMAPRPDRFTPPGPRLHPARHPRLFAEIKSLAERLGQRMPVEVYLAPDLNAWVGERGGFLGFGSRRIMGVGLPTLVALDVKEFRSMLSHEFGHFAADDTTLGPWVYRVHAALQRALAVLPHPLLQLLFWAYAVVFLRVSLAVCRSQERQADDLAVRIEGPGPFVSSLKKSHGAAGAYLWYWTEYVETVLSAGFKPPLAEGFGCFLNQPEVGTAMTKAVDDELRNADHNPYDTHPPLRERLVAVAAYRKAAAEVGSPPALSLLDSVPELERQLLAAMADRERTAALKSVTWEAVGEKVLVPMWFKYLRENSKALADVTVEALPTINVDRVGSRMKKPGPEASRAADGWIGTNAAAAALTILLFDRGYTLEVPPGGVIAVRTGETRVEPFMLSQAFRSGELTAEAWRDTCAQLGIAGIDLGRYIRDRQAIATHHQRGSE